MGRLIIKYISYNFVYGDKEKSKKKFYAFSKMHKISVYFDRIILLTEKKSSNWILRNMSIFNSFIAFTEHSFIQLFSNENIYVFPLNFDIITRDSQIENQIIFFITYNQSKNLS